MAMTRQENLDKQETAKLLGLAYGALSRFANDYFAGDTISMTDVHKARRAIKAIDKATLRREARK